MDDEFFVKAYHESQAGGSRRRGMIGFPDSHGEHVMTPDKRQTFERLPDRIKRFVRPSLRIRPSLCSVDSLKPGQSRIGGIPDLPPGFLWPRYDGFGLSFIAQLDLAELANHFAVLPLPKQGSLAFFYDSNQRTWGYDPKDRGSALVAYFADPTSSLIRTPIPHDVSDSGRFPCASVDYHREETLPDARSTHFAPELSEAEQTLRMAFDDTSCDNTHFPRHRLGGYADCVQNPMELECQLVTNASKRFACGLYCGDDTAGYESLSEVEFAPGAIDWRLLLQVDSDDDAGMMWGDCGKIYFWIKDDDLRAHNFDKTWLILQCS